MVITKLTEHDYTDNMQILRRLFKHKCVQLICKEGEGTWAKIPVRLSASRSEEINQGPYSPR